MLITANVCIQESSGYALIRLKWLYFSSGIVYETRDNRSRAPRCYTWAPEEGESHNTKTCKLFNLCYKVSKYRFHIVKPENNTEQAVTNGKNDFFQYDPFHVVVFF